MKSTEWVIEYQWLPPAIDRPPFKEVEWLQWIWPFSQEEDAKAYLEKLEKIQPSIEFRLIEREP